MLCCKSAADESTAAQLLRSQPPEAVKLDFSCDVLQGLIVLHGRGAAKVPVGTDLLLSFAEDCKPRYGLYVDPAEDPEEGLPKDDGLTDSTGAFPHIYSLTEKVSALKSNADVRHEPSHHSFPYLW